MRKILILILIISQVSHLRAQINSCDSISYTIGQGSVLNVELNTLNSSNWVDSMNVYWQACNATTCYTGEGQVSYFPNIIQTDSVKVCYDLYVYSSNTNSPEFCNQCDSLIYDGNGWVLLNTGNTTSIDEQLLFSISDFYPNPATGIVYLDYSLNISSELVLIDLLGNEVKKMTLSSQGEKKINISDLSKGIYFGNIIINNKIRSIKKLIVR